MRRSQTAILALAAVLLLLLVPSLATGAIVDLARTGQIFCFSDTGLTISCDGTGQDGDILAGMVWPDPRFTDNGDGTITDNLTGLIWLADTTCIGQRKWFEAITAANALADGDCGLTDGSAAGDWRMPNFVELMSPTHVGVSDFITWLETFGFVNMTGHGFYSSTTKWPGPSSVYGYQFNHRFAGSFLKSGNYQTWPVRGQATGPMKLWQTGVTLCYDQVGNTLPCAGTGQDGDVQAGVAWPAPRFTDNGDGTVTDNLTDLIWLKNAGCFTDRDWSDALTDANNLEDGKCGLTDNSSPGDWRLPNTWEITSLIDLSSRLPAGHPFTDLPNQYHWTSTSWPVLANRGYICGPSLNPYCIFIEKTYEGSVWAVRGGNLPSTILFMDGFESGTTDLWVTSP